MSTRRKLRGGKRGPDHVPPTLQKLGIIVGWKAMGRAIGVSSRTMIRWSRALGHPWPRLGARRRPYALPESLAVFVERLWWSSKKVKRAVLLKCLQTVTGDPVDEWQIVKRKGRRVLKRRRK